MMVLLKHQGLLQVLKAKAINRKYPVALHPNAVIDSQAGELGERFKIRYIRSVRSKDTFHDSGFPGCTT